MWPMQLHRPSLPKKEPSNAAPAFYRLRDVVRICAISRSTIYRRIAEGTFPKQIRLGPKTSAWAAQDLQEWIDDPEGYRGIATTPANVCVAGAVCQRGNYYESSGGLGRNRTTDTRIFNPN